MVANMTLYNDRSQDAISAQGRHSTDDQLGGDRPGYWALHHKALAQKAKAIVQHLLAEDLVNYEKIRT